jgi:hypothetical protein
VPNSIADLFRGEQQKNIDWVFLQALKNCNMDVEQGAMLIYDIVCQYIIYLLQRIGHLLPEGLKIDRAIGLFHVHGHKEQCLYRYATTFIPGAAVTVGEILEMLWSSLNTISPTMRTATLAHRAETIDDHATDSNHHKMLGIGKYLFQCLHLSSNDGTTVSALAARYLQATEMSKNATDYFEKVSQGNTAALRNQWEEDMLHAEMNRLHNPAAMDILAASTKQTGGEESQAASADSSNIEQWIQQAIEVERVQCVNLL